MPESDCLQDSLNSAYRYLSYRPRSEAEIRHWLRQRGFAHHVIEEALAKLKEQNLIDDIGFARFWKDNRVTLRPRSKKLLARELKEKKVATDIVEQVTSDIDDEATAYSLGSARMPALAHLDYPGFYRRLSSYLAYRGFDYEVIRHTATKLWQERESG